jgi:hypothetical protein
LHHPSTKVVSKLAPKRVLETAHVFIFSNYPKREPVATISVAADGKSDPLFVLLTAFELLACKRVIDLEKNHNQLYHV